MAAAEGLGQRVPKEGSRNGVQPQGLAGVWTWGVWESLGAPGRSPTVPGEQKAGEWVRQAEIYGTPWAEGREALGLLGGVTHGDDLQPLSVEGALGHRPAGQGPRTQRPPRSARTRDPEPRTQPQAPGRRARVQCRDGTEPETVTP